MWRVAVAVVIALVILSHSLQSKRKKCNREATCITYNAKANHTDRQDEDYNPIT